MQDQQKSSNSSHPEPRRVSVPIIVQNGKSTSTGSSSSNESIKSEDDKTAVAHDMQSAAAYRHGSESPPVNAVGGANRLGLPHSTVPGTPQVGAPANGLSPMTAGGVTNTNNASATVINDSPPPMQSAPQQQLLQPHQQAHQFLTTNSSTLSTPPQMSAAAQHSYNQYAAATGLQAAAATGLYGGYGAGWR